MKSMKTLRQALASVIASKPRITVDEIKPEGDVTFHVKLNSLGLTKEDCANPVIWTSFFANFVGEFLVRENIAKFGSVLPGLDSAMYGKMVANRVHTDFGMVPDEKKTKLTFGLHLHFVYMIVTEGQRQSQECEDIDGLSIEGGKNFIDSFDASGAKSK
jgi:hypothetical protein